MKTLPAPNKPNKALKKTITARRRKERDNIKKRQKAADKKERDAARAWRTEQEARNNPRQIKERISQRFTKSLMKSLGEQIEAHMKLFKLDKKYYVDFKASENYNVSAPPMSAYTDFKSISITLNEARMPDPFGTPEDKYNYVMSVKGIFHHEAGHLIHTVPFLELAHEWDGLVGGTCHHNGGSLPASGRPHNPLVDGPASRDAEAAKQMQRFLDASNAPEGLRPLGLSLERLYGPLHEMWNTLEDQRMESRRVLDFPAAKKYLTTMVSRFLLTSEAPMERTWLLMAGRTYLPDEIRQMSKDAFPLDAEEWLTIVNRYKAATTTKTLMSAVIDGYLWYHDSDSSSAAMPDLMGGEHGEPQRSATERPGLPTNGDKAEEGAVTQDEEWAKAGKGGEDEGEGDSPPDLIDAGRGEGDPKLTQEKFNNAIKQMANAPGLAEKAMMDAVMQDAGGEGLFDFDTVNQDSIRGSAEDMTAEEVAAAGALVAGIEDALQVYVTANQPHWMNRQEDGVIEALEYRTREPGDLDYRRWFNGDDSEGFDIQVSVLADVSFSMQHHMRQLCVSLLAMKTACDNLGLDSTFSLWSDGSANYRIYERGPQNTVYPTLGGTNPTAAFNDMLTHNENNHEDHLVLVFTDGAWHGVDSVSRWRTAPNQRFVMVRFGGGGQVHDMDEEFDIKALNELPDLLESSLEALMSGKV